MPSHRATKASQSKARRTGGSASKKTTRKAAKRRAPRTERAAKPGASPTRALDTFVNPNPDRDYLIHIEIPEFTCLCPLTGQPDFATIELDYIADKINIELKGLKLYMWSYRNENAFHEACTNQILDDLVAACAPRFMRVTARWYVRGGIYTTVLAEHTKPRFKLQAPANLALFPRESPIR